MFSYLGAKVVLKYEVRNSKRAAIQKKQSAVYQSTTVFFNIYLTAHILISHQSNIFKTFIMGKRNTPEVNAGSMADIAFLLLIFFLVTTTIDKDKGIIRYLPIEESSIPILERNLLIIHMNSEGALLVNQELVLLEHLKTAAMEFIDNGGNTDPQSIYYCDYCKGARTRNASDHPDKAVITVSVNRDTPYDTYVAVQNELNAAYNHLRNRESQRLYGYDFTSVDKAIKEGTFAGNLKKTKAELKVIRDMFKMIISEAETQLRS
jgi:biopolymer transport protein ExbD